LGTALKNEMESTTGILTLFLDEPLALVEELILLSAGDEKAYPRG
jgi:hypothetical protein